MKNNNKTLPVSARYILGSLAFAGIFMIACNKDHCHPDKQTDNQQPPDITAERAALQTEYTLAKQANDTLALFHDSLQMCHNNALPHDSAYYSGMMSHCDILYHTHDSLMMTQHNSMHSGSGNMMDGGMMSGGGGMMGNNNSMNMNCTIYGMQCQTAIDSLHSMHANHHP